MLIGDPGVLGNPFGGGPIADKGRNDSYADAGLVPNALPTLPRDDGVGIPGGGTSTPGGAYAMNGGGVGSPFVKGVPPPCC